MSEEKKTVKQKTKDFLYVHIKKAARIAYYQASHIIPADDKIILFESSNGRNYTGNPRYIYEELMKQGLDKEYKCVWSFMDKNATIPGNGITVKRSFPKFLYYTLRSGTWIIDSRHLYYLRKNKKTKYIQTWHGTPLKKLALDMDYIDMSGNKDIESYHEEFRKNTADWDYLISQNSYSSEIFKRAFDFKGEMLEIGYPRNDILVNSNNPEYIDEIKTRLNIPKDKKVILYAPTWRDNEYYHKGQYKFATEMDFDAMHENLKDDYVMIIKFHYLVKENIDWSKYNNFIIECNADWDIQELYLISDMMITDYSSVMFDYALLKRPMIFYTYDLNNYKSTLRDFYFDMINEVPGPICETNEELISFIKNYTEDAYKAEYGEKYARFNEKFNEFDDGRAANSIIELIKGEPIAKLSESKDLNAVKNESMDESLVDELSIEKSDDAIPVKKSEDGSKPFISIIIPFNATKRYLKDCLDSLIYQGLQDIETIIIINGIAKDDLKETDRLIESYPQLNIVKKVYDEEINVSKARNEGIKLAKGEYIYLIDSDDYLYSKALAKMADIAKDTHADFINGERIISHYIRERIDEQIEGEKSDFQLKKSNKSDLEFSMSLLVLKDDETIELLSCLHSLIKKSIIDSNGISFDEDKKYYSDYGFIAKVIKSANSFKGVGNSIYIKRERDDSINLPSLNQELSSTRLEYSIDEYKSALDILKSDASDKKDGIKESKAKCSKEEILINEISEKLYNFYLDNYSKNFRSNRNKEWRTTYFDKMYEISNHFKPRGIFQKMELKALQKRDKKSLRRFMTIRLSFKKVKDIIKEPWRLTATLYYNVFNRMSIKNKKIVFISFRGDFYTDSPKYIYQYLYETYGDEFEYVWIFNDKTKKVPGKVKKVKRFSLPYYYHLATAKYWVTNGRQPDRLSKRPKQEIVSTWHGTPLKRLGLDIGNIYSGSPKIKNKYINNAKEWEYLISANEYTTEILKSSFAYDRDILEIGYPRNDILYNASSDDVEKIKMDLNLPDDKKIILYAPTWRDDQFYDLGEYKFDLELDLNRMKEELGDEYIILIRTHYFIADNLDLSKYDGFAFDVSKYEDIAELYLISDLLITDYSSVFFDYANLKRPILFFTYDLDRYENVLRGFYLDIHTEVPGPLVFTTDEVIDKIKNVAQLEEEYKDRYDEFYNRFCSIDDGNASKRLVKIVWKKN